MHDSLGDVVSATHHEIMHDGDECVCHEDRLSMNHDPGFARAARARIERLLYQVCANLYDTMSFVFATLLFTIGSCYNAASNSTFHISAAPTGTVGQRSCLGGSRASGGCSGIFEATSSPKGQRMEALNGEMEED